MIKLGTATAKPYLGGNPINRIFLGTTVVHGSAYTPPPAISAEFITSASSITNAIAVPALAEAGDLAIIVDFAANPQPSDTVPSGWTKLQTVAMALGVGHRVTSYAKYLVSGDLGTNVSGLDSGSEGRVIFIVRDAGTSFAAAGLQSVSETSTDPTSITVTPAANSHPLLGLAVKYTYGGNSAFTSGTFDVTQSANTSSVGSIVVGLRRQLTDSNAFSFDSGDNGNAQLQAGLYLSLSE